MGRGAAPQAAAPVAIYTCFQQHTLSWAVDMLLPPTCHKIIVCVCVGGGLASDYPQARLVHEENM